MGLAETPEIAATGGLVVLGEDPAEAAAEHVDIVDLLAQMPDSAFRSFCEVVQSITIF